MRKRRRELAAFQTCEPTNLPLEIGLADIHQALTQNGMRVLLVLGLTGLNQRRFCEVVLMGADEIALGTVLPGRPENAFSANSAEKMSGRHLFSEVDERFMK